MRLITKLWTTLLLLCVAGVANAAKTYEVDQKFTSIAELDGQAFAIVNEAEAKAVFGSGAQNLGYDAITTAVTGSGNSGYYFKVEAVEGGYLLRLQTPAGEPYSIWGNPGYLNSGAPGGFDGCFLLGLNNQNGQDVENGAVWEIEYAEGLGFTFKNVALGGYFAGPNPAPTATDPIYWTFCTLKEGEEVPDPEPVVIPEPEAPLAEGELIPDFFSICDEGGIPYGYDVKFGSEDRAYPTTYTGGARIFNFAEGGDFTKAIYYREGYVQYGNVKKLALEAGKKYIVYFNSAMWKDSGATLEFTITKEDEETAILTQTINNTPNVNGAKDAVTGSTRSEIEFTPEADGNYILKWNAEGWKEVLLANVGVKVAPATPDPTPAESVEVTFDFNASDHAVSASGDTSGDITAEEVNTVNDVVMTISPAASGTANRYWGTANGPQLRMYSGTMTLEAPEGRAITKVVINNGKWNAGNTFNGVIADKGEWEGNSTNVVLAIAGNTQMNSIVVTLACKNAETTTYGSESTEPEEPLTNQKETLESAINAAKMVNGLAYTEATFGALITAISDGETALTAVDATAESLTRAATAITNAMSRLILKEGITELKTNMFMSWDSATAPTTGTAIGCAYELCVPSGVPYGDANVGYLNFANLAGYDKLYITYTEGFPRILMNRDVDKGQWNVVEDDSHLIDFPKEGWVEKYFTNDDGIVTVDLRQMVADKGVANLNTIKGANWTNVTVTGLFLYKEASLDSTLVETDEVIFDFNASDHAVSASGDTAGDITADEVNTVNDVIMTISPAASGTANRYWGTANGPQLRMYSGTMTLEAPEGKAITKVVINNGKWNAGNTFNGVAADKGEWEGNSTNVVLAIAGNTQMNSIVVTLADKTAETTTYGTEPAPEPVHIANTAETAYTVAKAIELIDAGEALTETVFVKGIVSQVDKIQGGAITYWISADGTTEGQQFECYKGKNIDGADFAALEDVEVGAEVIVKGTLTKYGETYEFNQGNELVSYKAPFKPLFADGKYYIYNVGAQKYLAAGANWGTHAVVNADGLDYIITATDGKYTLDSQVSNGGNSHFLNGEWNDGAAMGWIFAPVEGAEGVYTISDGTNFLTAQDNGEVTLAADATAVAAQWTLKTLADRLAELATATVAAPVDATFLIQDANFGRNDLRKGAWSFDASNKNISGGNNINNNAESYHAVFTLSQTLTNAPAGKYQMTAQGFYRQDDEKTEALPVFYANEKTAEFPAKTGEENSMSMASESFTAGLYTIEPIEVTVFEDGQLTIGAKGTATSQWVIFDNFRLTYLGVPALEVAHTWDFTKWSEATIANLKADAAASKVVGWSDVEKKADAEADADPTEASKDNCFWAVIPEGGELTANGEVIAELKGLQFGATFAGNRSLAIAVNYPETSLGTYAGPSYLWLGGKNFECFTIPAVKGGTTITMGVESHKITDARGVKLFAGETELMGADGNAVAAPTTYTEQTWTVPAGVAYDIVVKNTNGCHIYFIDAEIGEPTIIEPEFANGDVNHDEQVDVTDAVLIIDDILLKNPANFDASLADVNHDNEIDVTDVVLVIDNILGKIELSRGATRTEKDLTAYTAFQMDLTIPAGYVLEGVELTEMAKKSHSLAYNMLSDGRCRVVVFSMDNEALPGAWDEVIRLNLRGQGETFVNVGRAMFVTVGGERHELLLNGTTSIAQLSTLNSQFSIVYDLQGRKVEKTAKGVYVIDGKKVVIK